MWKEIEAVRAEISASGQSIVYEEDIPAFGSETHSLTVKIRKTLCGGVPGHYAEVAIFDAPEDDAPSFLRGDRVDGESNLAEVYRLAERHITEALSRYSLH